MPGERNVVMVGIIGGIALWLGGWWFTGRLFAIYRKQVLREQIYIQRSGQPHPRGHHLGAVLFSVLDFGFLLVGTRSLHRLLQRQGWSSDESLTAMAMEWSFLACLFLIRSGMHFHHLYHDLWRGRAREAVPVIRGLGTVKRLWLDTPSVLRVLLILAPALAAVPILVRVVNGAGALPLTGSMGGAFLLWFLLPQALLVLALAPPITRLRRRARTGGSA